MKKQTIVPYLSVKGADQAIAFYQAVFDAKELERYQEPGERVGHCTLEIFGNLLFLSDEFPAIGVVSPSTLNGTSVSVHLQVPNVDSTFEKALAHGATGSREPSDQPYGERNAIFIDPFGHRWMVGAPLEPQENSGP